MTSKERFRLVMQRQLPDRMPVDMLWPRNETTRALMEHFGVDTIHDIHRKLGVDFVWTGPDAQFPEFAAKCNGELTGDAPGAGNAYIFHDRDTFEDAWGVVQRVGADGKYVGWVGGPLVGKETLEGWSLPTTKWASVEAVRQKFAAYPDQVIIASVSNPYKTAWHICGYEHFMLMMALDPNFVHELYEHLFAWETERAVLAARAGADIIAVVGDVAGSNGPMFSIEMWREFIQPGFQKMIRSIKAANPESTIFFHSDGELKSMIPAFIETGIEILNPIESNCMDPAALKREFGAKIAFHGAISVQKTIPNGTVADVKNEVYERIRTVGYNGGYMVSNENSFPYDAPLENVLAMYEAVHDFNYQSLR